MKAFSTHHIISTPVTNSQLQLRLIQGQLVIGTITKRISSTLAMVRIGNQIYETNFPKGVPVSNHLLLRFDSIKGNRYTFVLVPPQSQTNDILHRTPQNMHLFLQKLQMIDSLTPFLVYKAMVESDYTNVSYLLLSPLFKRLQQRGIPKQLLHKFSYTLSKEPGINAIVHSLHNHNDFIEYQLSDNEVNAFVEMLSKEDIMLLMDYLTQSDHRVYSIPIPDGDSFTDALVVTDDAMVCIDITFSALGQLNITLQKNNALIVTLYCFTDAGYAILMQRCGELSALLRDVTGNTAICRCLKRNEWNEKIVALIYNMYVHYSLDISV